MSELESVLEIILQDLEVLYIVVDAVDESVPCEELLALITKITLDARFRKIKTFATSRQYVNIERAFSNISTGISMSNAMVDVDIRCFVRARLATSPRLRRWHFMFNEIENIMVAKAQGM